MGEKKENVHGEEDNCLCAWLDIRRKERMKCNDEGQRLEPKLPGQNTKRNSLCERMRTRRRLLWQREQQKHREQRKARNLNVNSRRKEEHYERLGKRSWWVGGTIDPFSQAVKSLPKTAVVVLTKRGGGPEEKVCKTRERTVPSIQVLTEGKGGGCCSCCCNWHSRWMKKQEKFLIPPSCTERPVERRVLSLREGTKKRYCSLFRSIVVLHLKIHLNRLVSVGSLSWWRPAARFCCKNFFDVIFVWKSKEYLIRVPLPDHYYGRIRIIWFCSLHRLFRWHQRLLSRNEWTSSSSS